MARDPLRLPPINGQPVHFDEAIRAAEERGVVLPDVYYGELQGIARQLAFSIAGIAGHDQLQTVMDGLTAVTATGKTFGEWQQEQVVKDLNLPSYRLDNIFRTNLQANYQAGHWEQYQRNQDARPYLMYDAINDSRVRLSHLALDGKIWRIDDPQLRTHAPPNGYRCRCGLISLTAAQARARSGDGTGLNKLTVLPDGTPAQPDKGWAYSPRDRLQGVEQALAKRQTQSSGVLLSALNEKLSHALVMNRIKIPEFAIAQKKILEIANDKTEWFPVGFGGIHAVDRSDFFAATSDAAIYFSADDRLLDGFKPALALASAFNKIDKGIALNFNEEYAVETLWHELLHLRARHDALPENPRIRLQLEGAHQWLARRTYQRLLNAAGGAANNQIAILTGGYAYADQAINFQELITVIGLDEKEMLPIIENLWLSTQATELKTSLINRLAEKSGKSANKITKLLGYLSEESGDFKAKAEKIMSY